MGGEVNQMGDDIRENAIKLTFMRHDFVFLFPFLFYTVFKGA